MNLTRRGLIVGSISVVLLPRTVVASDSIRLGNTVVKLRLYDYGKGYTFFAPHHNETTAVVAAKSVASKYGGRIIQLEHNSSRNIDFTLDGRKYVIDPNRIYTNVGIQKTLTSFGGDSPKVRLAVVSFAEEILKRLLSYRSPIIALHNNSASSYGIKSYLPGGSEVSAASEVTYNEQNSPDDFFLTTNKNWYKKFSVSGFNVVLQSSSPPNDGSLSVYCGQHSIPYLNVEAGHGHLAYQKKMLEAVFR